MQDRPQFWIVAGPNGAGKSTVGSCTHGVDRVLDPDAVCKKIRRTLSPLSLLLPSGWYSNLTNYLAVVWVEVVVAYAVTAGRPVAVETVLSSEKYLKHVHRARARGFSVKMVFVALPDPDDHVERVALRVKAGGHDVPVDKIRSRWLRSHHNLQAFLPLLDYLVVFSNVAFSGDGEPEPTLVVEKVGSSPPLIFAPDALPEVTRVLQGAERLGGVPSGMV